MTLEDAAHTICWWLGYLRVRIAPALFVRETDTHALVVTVQQMEPQQKRVFEVVPLDIADCYEVREVAA